MTNKPPRAGGETDSWCTKCQLLLNHRIVAVDKGKPVKVECFTCRTVHMYRPHAPGQKPAAAGSARAAASPSAGAARASRSSPPTKAAMAEQDRVKTWEKAIAGKALGDFRAYRVSEIFREGELVRHSRFGDGVVLRILDEKKVEVLFKDETKTLAQNLTD